MTAAQYQDIPDSGIPQINSPGGGSLRLLAGTIEYQGRALQGPMPARTTEPLIIDLHLPAGASWHSPLPANHTVLVLAYAGATTELAQHELGLYKDGDTLVMTAGEKGAQLLVLAGKPLKEPVKQYGPFVMNTVEEIRQAIADYQEGTLVALGA
jgi:redox-sensitive bicupin YhaK (pirin superfamily)